MAEQDSRNSLRHILADDPVEGPSRKPAGTPQAPPAPEQDDAAAEGSFVDAQDGDAPVYTSTTQTTRRNANGSVSSVYSGNKIKHLKKEDGIPLWRKDIQFEFLQLVFGDEQRVFTQHSDGTKGHTFAEIYIDAMAKSSKTSKILKEKLASDQSSALSMAMVCLLVNVGRMNTTLNFFPEMRAQLRTYHSIPALQAHQDPSAYKQLQDAPRLKSILKGATEDEPQPGTVEEIKAARIPRTNPVNLIFVLSQYAPKISEVHFSAPRDFFDLVMRPALSSKSRTTAFLWLVWWYLESDFSQEDALRNPFGPGQDGEHTGGLSVKVPHLEVLTEEQAAQENIDTEEERSFGESKRRERIAIVKSEPSPAMTALKRARKERSLQSGYPGPYNQSDNEGTYTPSREYQSPAPQGSGYSGTRRDYASSEHSHSPSPPPSSGFHAVNVAPRPSSSMQITSMLTTEDSPPPQALTAASSPGDKKKGPGRGNWRRNKDKGSTHHEQHPLLPNIPGAGTSYGFIHESPAPASGTLAFPAISPYASTAGPTAQALSPASFCGPEPPKLLAKQSDASIDTHVPTPSYQSSKRSRPLTSHQVAITEYRRNRISYILSAKINTQQREARRERRQDGSLLRAWKRIRLLPSGWDSDEEEGKAMREAEKRDEDGEAISTTTSTAKSSNAKTVAAAAAAAAAAAVHRPVGGIWMAGFVKPGATASGIPREEEDIGEEAREYARALATAVACLERWDHAALDGRTPLRIEQVTRASMAKRRRRHSYLEFENEDGGFGSEPARPKMKRALPGAADGGAAGAAATGRKGGRAAGGNGYGKRAGGGGGGHEHDDEEMMEGAVDEDEDDMDVDREGELDEEDRELLGEIDADETDSENEDDDDWIRGVADGA